jgi:hypothetical protein
MVPLVSPGPRPTAKLGAKGCEVVSLCSELNAAPVVPQVRPGDYTEGGGARG